MSRNRLFIAIALSMLTACSSLTPRPLACEWKIPAALLQPCPRTLPGLKSSGATMGDLLQAAVKGFELYHACRIDHDALIAAYRQYEQVCKPTAKETQ